MKILQYKLNAIMAKSRAIYGRRLTQKDYDSLINCSSVSEITAFLRNSTIYAPMLEKVSSADISAGYLEFIIKKTRTEIFSKLYRYEVAFGQELYNYFAVSEEIDFILLCIRRVIFNNGVSDVFSGISSYKTDLNIRALTSAENIGELTAALESTPYKDIVSKCSRSGGEYIDYECAFINYLNEYIFALAEKCCGKNSSLLRLLSSKADTEFIDKLYRTKKFFSVSSKRILGSIYSGNLTNLSRKQIDLLLGASDEKALLEILLATPYREYAQRISEFDYVEHAIAQINYEKHKRLLRFSNDPNEVMFCFMFLIENEINNLIHIIEGVKYKMDAVSIRNLLIGVGD